MMKALTGQKGFTLLELLVVLAIEAVLLVVIVGVLSQTAQITMSTNPKIAALEDIQRVAGSIQSSIRMSGNYTTPVDGASSNALTLGWDTYDANGVPLPTHSYIYYTLSGGRLQRVYTTQTTYAGKYISNINFSRTVNILKVVITSSPEGKAETAKQMTYQFYLRPTDSVLQ
jgi:prepilin-type N-terminal cleavage/methylation domain-containing protein